MFQNFVKKCAVFLPFVKNVALHVTRKTPRILMYHRFSESSGLGISKDIFKWQLEVIKKDFKAIRLSEYIEYNNYENPLKPLIVITVDDGYNDFYEIAYPLLVKNKIPGTFFVTTRFIDGNFWFWFDKIRFVITETSCNKATYNYKNRVFPIKRSTVRETDSTWNLLSDYCLELSEEEKSIFVDKFAHKMEVKISVVPDMYKSASWSNIKELSDNDIEIGSHTLSHPILTKLGDKQVLEEIELSKAIIEEKIGKEVNTFAYPNGKHADYNTNVIEKVKNAGYRGAVVAHDGINSIDKKYTITRMCIATEKVDFLWKIYGMDYIVMKTKNLISHILSFIVRPLQNIF